MIEPGRPAPDFTLPDQDGTPTSLKDLEGETVVLYFYPKADTAGCTTQACGVRDAAARFEEVGVRVIGVSPDPVARVKAFHDGQGLNFTLLADEDHAVTERYGAWVEKSLYGNRYMGAARTTYVIGPDGTIAAAIPKSTPKHHVKDVMKALAGLET